MRVWAACVVLFFGVAEAYQWMQGLTLPLPVVAVAGLLLAIVSNLDRDTVALAPVDVSASASVPASIPPSVPTSAPASPQSTSPVMPPELRSEVSPQSNQPQLPNLDPPSPSISFTIEKPTHSSSNPAQKTPN